MRWVICGNSDSPPKPARPLWAAVAWGCVLGALTAGGVEIGRMILSNNRHTVIPGVVYRSGQLDGRQLNDILRRKGIRSVVNLRGQAPEDWYDTEARGTAEAGVSQEDVTLSAGRLPSPHELRRMIDVFDRTEYPLLIHCQQGSDRTGLAVAVWQLLYTDADEPTARRQCSLRYGHTPILRTAQMDAFFDLYEARLAERNVTHSPATFRAWAANEYKPGLAWAKLEFVAAPAAHPAARPVVYRVRATNLSDVSWEMCAGTAVGVHARYWVWAGHGDGVFYGQAGLRNGSVAPGQTVELALPIPAMPRPGRYRVVVELAVGRSDFSEFGVGQLVHAWDALPDK